MGGIEVATLKQSTDETVVDSAGKVIQKRSTRVISWGEEPAYIKLYVKDLMYMADMPKQYANLTMSLLKRVSYAGEQDGMCVTLVPRIKKSICQELGWEKVSTLDNALQKLLKGKIIYRVDRGVYRLNPYLFGKGDWADISKIRMEIGYSIEGRTFSTTCEYADEQPQKPVKTA